MSDLFHDDVPAKFIARVWATMKQTPRHTYQILTKRPDRMAEVLSGSQFEILPNVGLGTSVEDGRVLSESGAILFYLARGTRLLPDDPWDEAQVLRWMFFEQYGHEPYVAVNRYILRYAPEAERARLIGRVPDNHVRGQQALAVLEQHLAGADWLAAGRYTIADIALYAYTHVAHEGGFDLEPYPAVRAWLARVRSQPRHIPITQG